LLDQEFIGKKSLANQQARAGPLLFVAGKNDLGDNTLACLPHDRPTMNLGRPMALFGQNQFAQARGLQAVG
jgi:hypothetical protein